MSYENEDKKQQREDMLHIIRQERAKKEIKQIKKQNLNSGFKNWFKMMKAGKTEYQRKVAKSLREEKE